jgi:transcriptional regulator with XRE-family HTH domain
MLKGISDLSTISSRIKYYRLINDLTQEELAVKSNLDRTTIIRYENDLVDHSLDVIDRIAKALKIKPSIIYDDYLKFINGDYGSKIRNLRMGLGLSQKKLGKILEVHRKTISRWEKEESFPTRENYIKLITIYDFICLFAIIAIYSRL